MLLTVILIVSRAWCGFVNLLSKLLPHAVLDVEFGLFGLILTRARVSLHLPWVDVGLDSSCVLGASIGINGVVVLAGTGLLDVLSSETLVLGRGPRRCLDLVLRWSRVYVGSWHVT